MTKVAAPVVKMVEPLLELIDFEEEIKVEKISKDECKTPDIDVDNINSEEEIKNNDNKFKKILQNKKQRTKILKKVISEINSNSTDSTDYSENSNKSSNLETTQTKLVILRRNPSRRTSYKEDNITKTNTDPQNIEVENKKSLITRQTTKKMQNAEKNDNLICMEPNRNSITSSSEIKKYETTEKISSKTHVPTMIDENISSTSEINVNNKNLEVNQEAEILKQKHINADERKNELNEIEEEIKIQTEEITNCIQIDEVKNNEDIEQIDELNEKSSTDKNIKKDSYMENTSNQNNSDVEVQLDSTQKEEHNISNNKVEAQHLIPEINPNDKLKENTHETGRCLEFDNDFEVIMDSKNEELSLEIKTVLNSTTEHSNLENEENNMKTSINLIRASSDFEEKNLNTKKVEHELCNNVVQSEEISSNTIFNIKNNSQILNIKNESKTEINILNENILFQEISSDNHKIEKTEDQIENENSETETKFADSNESTLLDRDENDNKVQIDSGERFFIFDDIIEEENSTCRFTSNNKQNINVNEKICGEIIHKTQEDFSINCYMCWDDENWTFKKFNDLKLFSAHLNSRHSNDEIQFQNQRGNSFSLDFVNENSCVMPQSMWFGIYNEMISLKCGFAKIGSNGFIHYSCLACKQNFKNFGTFTKHILGRKNKNNGHNCSIEQEPPKSNSSNLIPVNKLINTDSKAIVQDRKGEIINDNNLIIDLQDSKNKIEKEINQCTNERNIIKKPEKIQKIEEIVQKISFENKLLNVSSKAISEDNNLDSVKTEQFHNSQSNTIPTDSSNSENNKINEIINDGIPDIYGYKKIASAIFGIFDKDHGDSISTKLDKILLIDKKYRDIKEKERLEIEQKEKLRLLNLAMVIDSKSKLEGMCISSKNIDVDNKNGLLTCKYCNRQYTCLTNLREHFRVHVGERILLCYTCQRGFLKKGNLEEHISIFHVGSSKGKFDLDSLGDNRKDIAKNTNITTNKNNSKEKGYKCQYCPRFLSNRNILEDHLRLHFGEKPLKCDQCNLQFLKKTIYENHIIQVHETNKTLETDSLENFKVDSYDKENNKPLPKYVKLNVNKIKSNKKKFKCKQCSANYPTKIGLVEHLILIHSSGEYKCKYCEQTFESNNKRSYHEKIHESGTKFQCSFCSRDFTNLFTLELHENSHKQNGHFKCRYCDHYFASENTKKLHEDVHEAASDSNEDLKIQTVDIATILQMNNEQAPINSNGNANDSNGTSSDATDKSSNQNTTSKNLMVKKIMKKFKRGKRDPNSPLDCRYCKKHFESPHQLSYHERLHEIGKKFQCNLCDKILATSYALELHLTSHLKKKKKGILNKKFNGSTILANQLALHRRNQEFKPKIEIVSDVALAPTQTMAILNNFFKREIPAITVTTTSEDDSFQKIGVDDIEKNLAAHVLRDTDPYYQLMADFSYQYQLYQTNSVPAIETESGNAGFPMSRYGFDDVFDEQQIKRPKKGRRKKINNDELESIIKTTDTSKSYFYNQQINFEIQPQNNNFENEFLESSPNITLLTQQNNLTPAKDSNKKKEKKKISPDITKNVTSVYIKCEYCNKKYNASDKKLLNRHRRLHIAGDTHKCSFCKKCFATLYYLDKHLRVHHLNHITELKCKSCDSVYALKEALRGHEIRFHKKNNLNAIFNKTKIEGNLNENNYNENFSRQHNTKEHLDTQYVNDGESFAIPEVPKPKRKTKTKDLKLNHCNFCDKSFSTQCSLEIHIERTHQNFEENYNITCTYENCKKRFESQTNLEKHIRLHESDFKCSICDKKTISQILLDHHMRSHGIPTSFACKYCRSKFTMQLTKDKHEKKMHSKGSIYVRPKLIIKKYNMSKRKISYRCHNCEKSFSSLFLLKVHNMHKHPVFECNTCPAMFSKICDLQEHEKIHLKTLQCNLCDKTFENKHTLYKHRRQHETKFFKCNMCPAEFSFRDELNEHKKNHDESEKPFKCVEMGCVKAFFVESFLNTHLKKIHGYFLFNCDRCKREFLNEDLLIKHRKDHEVFSTDKQYRCDQCFKDFSTLTILKIHQKLHQSSVVAAAADAQTPDPQKTSKLKLYTCEQCDKRFSIVTYLNNHLKKVHQVKLFVCESCKMEFRNERDLQEHSKVHLTGKKFVRVEKTHLDRPFKCELCGNSYAILAYLNNHLNKAHGNEEILDEQKTKNVKKNSKNHDTNENDKTLNENNKLLDSSNNDKIDLKLNTENSNENVISNENNPEKLPPLKQKQNNSIKCTYCYLRFISQKYLKDHAKMHEDPNDTSRIEMLESAFNPRRSEKILNPVINSNRSNNINSNNNNNQNQQQAQKQKLKRVQPLKSKKKSKKQQKLKVKTYEEDSSSSMELINVSEPPEVPEHNLSYTQITEALSSASSGLTAIQPVEVIESVNDDDQQMTTTELTPLTTLTSLTSLTPLTPLQPTAIFHHSQNDSNILQSQQQHQQQQLQSNSTPIELTSLEPSTISEATKLSLTLLEPSALSELTAFTEPSVHTSNLTALTTYVNDPISILHHEHTVLTELTSTSTSTSFDAPLITTQCNNSSTILNTSSASSDYAVTNMDTSQITQQVKKPRISDANMNLETFTMLDDNSNQTDNKSQSELTNFLAFDGRTEFLSSKITDHNMEFTDMGLSTKSIMSDSTSLEPLTYSDSMPLSEATTIFELTSSSHPTSSSEATAFSESNTSSLLLNSTEKKKRSSGSKSSLKTYKPSENEIKNLDGNFDTSLENNNFKCTLCKRIYDCWHKFRKHNEYHSTRPNQCTICPSNFKTNDELLQHNKVHANSKNSFSCEICHRVFVSKSRLKAHTLTVHTEERRFKCEHCPSAFKTKSRLVDHVRGHTGEKPIKCHYCDEHFSRATYRLKHERAIHPELLEIDTKHKEEKLKEKKSAANVK